MRRFCKVRPVMSFDCRSLRIRKILRVNSKVSEEFIGFRRGAGFVGTSFFLNFARKFRKGCLSQCGNPPFLQATGKTISCSSQWRVPIPPLR